MDAKDISRKNFLARTGTLIVGFSFVPIAARSLVGATAAVAAGSPSASSVIDTTSSDAWLVIASDGSITVYSGKVELGTGIQTALSQIVAEELYVGVEQVSFVQGDTALTPNQGYTAGSQTVQGGGVQLRQAAATAFQALLSQAAALLHVPTTPLRAANGKIGIGHNLNRAVSYGQLVSGQQFHLPLNPTVTLKDPSTYQIVGTSVPRADLPAKFLGTFTYVQDVVVPGMLHGRVVRPAGRNATLASITVNGVNVDAATFPSTGFYIAPLASGATVVAKGNFVGVVAADEWAAIQAASQLNVIWQQGAPLAVSYDGTAATRTGLIGALQNNVYNTAPLSTVGNGVTGLAAPSLQASYFSPYHMHAATGPSCAVADVRIKADPTTGIQATIWSGTQGVYQLQGAIAQLLGHGAKVQVTYVEASGCYGHNGADDAAADAALLSQAIGAPVRVQWMRPDEHGWEPLGPAMSHTMQGWLDASGAIVAWAHTLWSQTHSTRPSNLAGNLLAGQELSFPPQSASPVGLAGGRNSIVNYTFPNSLVTANSVASYSYSAAGGTINILPRTTALRSLGGLSNVFANESFMDELAAAAKVDPVAFRLQYLSDPRGIAVLKAVADEANWASAFSGSTPSGLLRGRGVAYLQYENTFAYVATYAEVLVDPTTGIVQVTRVIVAHDCGLIINPDGLKNQIEGNVIQATSRTLMEEVLFDTHGVTSTTWDGAPTGDTWSTTYTGGEPNYRILRFTEAPRVTIVLIDQPTQPAWGAGEPVTEAMAAVIGNAIFNATGKRLRTLPFTPANVLAGLAGNG